MKSIPHRRNYWRSLKEYGSFWHVDVGAELRLNEQSDWIITHELDELNIGQMKMGDAQDIAHKIVVCREDFFRINEKEEKLCEKLVNHDGQC